MNRKLLVAGFLGGIFLSSASEAVVVANAFESGGNVEFVASGSLDLTGMVFDFSPLLLDFGRIQPNDPEVTFGAGSGDIYRGFASTPATFGSGGITDTPVVSGDFLLFENETDGLGVPVGYISGDPLSAAMTFNGASFASLGMVSSGTFVWELPNDTITFNIGRAPDGVIPLPAGLPLLVTALASFALLHCVRRA